MCCSRKSIISAHGVALRAPGSLRLFLSLSLSQAPLMAALPISLTLVPVNTHLHTLIYAHRAASLFSSLYASSHLSVSFLVPSSSTYCEFVQRIKAAVSVYGLRCIAGLWSFFFVRLGQRITMSETEKSTAKKVNEIRLSVPWGHVAAKTYGSASNFPVLCTHGHLDNLGSLHRLISLLPPHYYYVSIDLPGHGWSSHFPSGQPLDFFNYVLTIQYVVEALNWSSFHYIGHSFGIQLGVFFSIIYPGRIKRLIGIDGFFPPIIPDDRLLSNVQQNLEQAQESTGDHKTFTRDEVMYRLRCKRKFCLNTPAAEATFERSVSEVDNGQYRYNRDPRLRRYVLPILNTDRTMEVLANLQVKSMVIFSLSTFKIFKPEVAEMLKGFFENNDNIEAVFVEGNHDVHNNHPERLVEHISKFLDSYSITNKL